MGDKVASSGFLFLKVLVIIISQNIFYTPQIQVHQNMLFFCRTSLADSGVDLDLRCIENVLTDYDSQHLQEQEST